MVIYGGLAYIFLDSGLSTKTKVRVNYEDDSDVYYRVNYIDNNYVSTNKDRYVSDMVEYIDMSYIYNNLISEYVSGYYKYNVDGYLIAYEDDITNSLWEREYELVSDNTVEAIKLVEKFRSLGYKTDFDMTCKKFSKQLEKAAKSALFAVILGEDEIAGGYLTLKNLETSKQTEFSTSNINDFAAHTQKFISNNSEEWQSSKLTILSSGFVKFWIKSIKSFAESAWTLL